MSDSEDLIIDDNKGNSKAEVDLECSIPSTSSDNKTNATAEAEEKDSSQDLDIEMSDSSDGSISDSDRCAICLGRIRGKFGSPDAVGCEHYFCLLCILEWAKNNPICPQDRRPFGRVLVRNKIGGKVKSKIQNEQHDSQENNQDFDSLTYCEVCGSSDREDCLLLCDGCDLGYHLDCLTPPLSHVPIEEWFCPLCVATDLPSVLREASKPEKDVRTHGSDDEIEAKPSKKKDKAKKTKLPRRPRMIPRTRASERVLQRISQTRKKEVKKRKKSRGSRDCSHFEDEVFETRKEKRSKAVQAFKRANPFGTIADDDVDAAFNSDEYADMILSSAFPVVSPTKKKKLASEQLKDSTSMPSASYSGRSSHPKLDSISQSSSKDVLSNILEDQSVLLLKSKDVLLNEERKLAKKDGVKSPDLNIDYENSALRGELGQENTSRRRDSSSTRYSKERTKKDTSHESYSEKDHHRNGYSESRRKSYSSKRYDKSPLKSDSRSPPKSHSYHQSFRRRSRERGNDHSRRHSREYDRHRDYKRHRSRSRSRERDRKRHQKSSRDRYKSRSHRSKSRDRKRDDSRRRHYSRTPEREHREKRQPKHKMWGSTYQPESPKVNLDEKYSSTRKESKHSYHTMDIADYERQSTDIKDSSSRSAKTPEREEGSRGQESSQSSSTENLADTQKSNDKETARETSFKFSDYFYNYKSPPITSPPPVNKKKDDTKMKMLFGDDGGDLRSGDVDNVIGSPGGSEPSPYKDVDNIIGSPNGSEPSPYRDEEIDASIAISPLLEDNKENNSFLTLSPLPGDTEAYSPSSLIERDLNMTDQYSDLNSTDKELDFNTIDHYSDSSISYTEMDSIETPSKSPVDDITPVESPTQPSLNGHGSNAKSTSTTSNLTFPTLSTKDDDDITKLSNKSRQLILSNLFGEGHLQPSTLFSAINSKDDDDQFNMKDLFSVSPKKDKSDAVSSSLSPKKEHKSRKHDDKDVKSLLIKVATHSNDDKHMSLNDKDSYKDNLYKDLFTKSPLSDSFDDKKIITNILSGKFDDKELNKNDFPNSLDEKYISKSDKHKSFDDKNIFHNILGDKKHSRSDRHKSLDDDKVQSSDKHKNFDDFETDISGTSRARIYSNLFGDTSDEELFEGAISKDRQSSDNNKVNVDKTDSSVDPSKHASKTKSRRKSGESKETSLKIKLGTSRMTEKDILNIVKVQPKHLSHLGKNSSYQGSQISDAKAAVPPSKIKLNKLILETKVVDEAKRFLNPYYVEKGFSKQVYKEIVSKIVNKVLDVECGQTVESKKIQKLVDGYVEVYLHRNRKSSASNKSL